MQIDFHHAVTYVIARLAGFSRPEAAIIGHSAQYVDDATNQGEIGFDNGAGYQRICSAHKMLDYRNFQALANSRVWLPFHFLPGNGGLSAGLDPEGPFVQKLVCRPDSHIAREMVGRAIAGRAAPYALHRLGITAHVYVDTWAHQGFVGVAHPVNLVTELLDQDERPDQPMMERVKTYFGDAWESIVSGAVDHHPLGHGAALSHPDMPFLEWSYTNGLGEKVERHNPRDFVDAAKHLFAAFVAYRTALGESGVPAVISDVDLHRIVGNLASFTDRDGDVRHAQWVKSVAAGDFSFGKESIAYVAKGPGSWKHQALGSTEDKETARVEYPYSPSFLTSDWKLFHDALQVHRLVVLHEVLPRYGICAA